MGSGGTKFSQGLADWNDSFRNNPLGGITSIVTAPIHGIKNQKIGEAEIAQQAAANANADAADKAPKEIDPLVEERRRRALIATGMGRDNTIKTPGVLGSADVNRKTLLGL